MTQVARRRKQWTSVALTMPACRRGHSTMKDLDRTKVGAAFMAEGLALIFDIDAELAGFLAKDCGEYRYRATPCAIA